MYKRHEEPFRSKSILVSSGRSCRDLQTRMGFTSTLGVFLHFNLSGYESLNQLKNPHAALEFRTLSVNLFSMNFAAKCRTAREVESRLALRRFRRLLDVSPNARRRKVCRTRTTTSLVTGNRALQIKTFWQSGMGEFLGTIRNSTSGT